MVHIPSPVAMDKDDALDLANDSCLPLDLCMPYFPCCCGGATTPSALSPSRRLVLQMIKIGSLVTLWLVCNSGISLVNKAVFQFAHFNYPIMLCALHFLFQTFFTQAYLFLTKGVTVKELDSKGTNIVRAFSVLFMLNILFGNASLRYVTVSFRQVFHSTIPAMVIPLSAVLLQKYFSLRVKLCLIPTLVGVALAAYGDIDFNIFGAVLCFVSCFLASLKSVLSNKFLCGAYSLHPFDLLNRVAPLAFLQLLPLSLYAGEAELLVYNWRSHMNPHDLTLILGSAIVSLLLNWVSFEVCRATSALTMSLVGTVRDTATVLLSVFIFGNVVTPVNAAGICLAMTGSALYSYVSYKEMAQRQVQISRAEEKIEDDTKPIVVKVVPKA